MPINKSDPSIRPGWTRTWYDGSGWTAADEFAAREEGWNLLINDDQITPYSLPVTDVSVLKSSTTHLGQGVYSWKPLTFDAADFMPKLLEQALSGNKTAYKALDDLMAFNDRRWKDYIPTVLALREDYGYN